MSLAGTLGLFGGAAAIGLLHGAEPGHGWPIAATYALDRTHHWASGLLASTLLGLGHLVSSLAVVAVFFLAKDYFDLTQLGWIRYVAGVLLIGLGIREYRRGGHSHGRESSVEHSHDDHSHAHDDTDGDGHPHDHGDGHPHDHGDGHPHDNGDDHPHDHGDGHAHFGDADSTDLLGLVSTAFVLGFVHEEEFEIIGLCIGSEQCLSLMLVYALAVIVSLVGLTMLLVAGYTRYEERVERYTEYFPTISAAVLILLGLAFILGIV